MTLVDSPPRAWASEVVGSLLEKDGASDPSPGTSLTTWPFSSTKIRRLLRGVTPLRSEWMSPRLELLRAELLRPVEREDRTKRPLLSLRRSVCGWSVSPGAGLELEA